MRFMHTAMYTAIACVGLLVLYRVHQHAWQLAYGPCIGSDNEWLHLFSMWSNAAQTWCEHQRQFGIKQMMYIQGVSSSLFTFVASRWFLKKNVS